jgi:hypothetical protein
MPNAMEQIIVEIIPMKRTATALTTISSVVTWVSVFHKLHSAMEQRNVQMDLMRKWTAKRCVLLVSSHVLMEDALRNTMCAMDIITVVITVMKQNATVRVINSSVTWDYA